MTVIKRVLVHS